MFPGDRGEDHHRLVHRETRPAQTWGPDPRGKRREGRFHFFGGDFHFYVGQVRNPEQLQVVIEEGTEFITLKIQPTLSPRNVSVVESPTCCARS